VRAVRYKAIEVALLLLGLAPLGALAVAAFRIWVLGGPIALWSAPTWGLYVLQLAALGAFAFHILGNARLGKSESSHWLAQIVLFHQVGMLSYWVQHVWGQAPRPRT
jgi:hypothetical protein